MVRSRSTGPCWRHESLVWLDPVALGLVGDERLVWLDPVALGLVGDMRAWCG